MIAKEVKAAYFQTLIDWISAHIEQYKPLQLDRVRIMTECNVPDWVVGRGILLLARNNVFIQDGLTYTLTDQIASVTGEQLSDLVEGYNKNVQQKAKDRNTQQLSLIDSNTTPLERATQNFADSMASFKFGFYCPENGYQWATSPEEATQKATECCIKNGLERVEIVQKVAVVVVQPTVSYY